MNGLDVITDKILSQARECAEMQKESMMKEKNPYFQEREQAIQKLSEEYEKKRTNELKMIKERSEAAIEQKSKQNLMQTKIDVINYIISESESAVLSMDDEKYFAAMKKLVVKAAPKGKCEIMFNKRDNERMPQGFMEECRKECPDAELSLSGNAADINGGFIISNGAIEENFAISDIIDFSRDELEDMLNMFFKE